MSAAPSLLTSLLEAEEKNAAAVPIVIKAIAWARVSTDMQEERGLSIPEQFREMRVYAEKEGIEIAAEFSEAASAFQREHKRIKFRRMVEAARANDDVSMILVHDMSRFSRDSVHGKQLVRELRSQGIAVRSLNDPNIDPDTSSGVYMEAFTFAKNEAYSRDIAMHTRKGCRDRLVLQERGTTSTRL